MDEISLKTNVAEKQYFTETQAQKLIPSVKKHLYCICQINNLINKTLDKLSQMGLAYQPDLLNSLNADQDLDTIDLLSTLKVSLASIKIEIKRLENLGCSLEDIDTGKVTWPALLNGKIGILAWSNQSNAIQTECSEPE